ncbi:cell wall hydrolase [Paracoccus litorisediminis]|nr:cell wall hydrolase [Paracoccus litorisediminis]
MNFEPMMKMMSLSSIGLMIWIAAQTFTPPKEVVVYVEVPAPVVVTQVIHAPISTARPAPRPDSLCLALNIYHEARGEPLKGQVAVGQVTLNRAAVAYKGASSVCDTVFARKQFSWTHEDPRQPSGAELRPSLDLARKILAGRYIDRTHGALHYYNPHKVDAWWADSYAEVAVLGNHRFMR